jgi:hypothetical protein
MYQPEVDAIVDKVRKTKSCERTTLPDGAEVYAYPYADGSVAWGINRPSDHVNILRGIRGPDGQDRNTY